MIISREILRNDLFAEGESALGDTAAQSSSGLVVIDFPARRIRCLLVDSRFAEPKRICIPRMTTAMLDAHRMIRNGGIQVSNVQRPTIFRFCVVILETEDPLASRRFCSTLAHCRLNGGDGTKVAIHHTQMR